MEIFILMKNTVQKIYHRTVIWFMRLIKTMMSASFLGREWKGTAEPAKPRRLSQSQRVRAGKPRRLTYQGKTLRNVILYRALNSAQLSRLIQIARKYYKWTRKINLYLLSRPLFKLSHFKRRLIHSLSSWHTTSLWCPGCRQWDFIALRHSTWFHYLSY